MLRATGKGCPAMARRRNPDILGRPTSPQRRLGPRGRFLLFLAGLASVLGAVTVFGDNGVGHLQELTRQERRLSERAFALLQRNEVLRTQIMQLHNDEHYLEALARQKLGLVKEREIVYRFAEPGRGRR